ncbi:hypothetical protein [Rhodococcus tibetensis]|uniref:Lipoprotein n=1 Tax=Rhodococcus tibetensis TaxID=2965064 RepID=A0ABT1QJ28_9NOCA|nr:hypothetical protein [Rhodococcus sp. FXJ9.536]MCQ4121785.1 hypothetical protein [Rhodococcus sp. FXJ9.536]
MGRMPRTFMTIAAVGAVLVASACGDNSSEPADATSGATASAEADGVPAGVVEQYETVEKEIAAEGGETNSGAWRVAYIVEPAEPWYQPDGSGQRFREPAPGETHHIEIIPFEAATGRIVPNVPITLEVVAADGRVVEAKPLNFYYSTFFHYANNFSVPEPGRYTLRAALGAPTFFRHAEAGEAAPLAEGVTVDFSDVELSPEN